MTELDDEMMIDVQAVPAGKKGLVVDGAFGADARARLAERFGFLSVRRLQAKLTIRQVAADCLEVAGTLDFAVTQACVASGQPVKEAQIVCLQERFVPPDHPDSDGQEVDIDDESVEYLENGQIPLGEMLAQHLALAANPFPRHPQAPENWQAGPPAVPEKPFAELSRLKNK